MRAVKFMHVGKKNDWVEYFVNGHKLEVVETEKDLGVVISSDLKCEHAANRVLGQAIIEFLLLD